MKKIKAYAAVELALLAAIIGAIGLGIGVLGIFCNWESHEEFTITFDANEKAKTTEYYACYCDSLSIYQETGNKTCKYNIYYKSRSQKSYEAIDIGLRFNENDVETSPYSLKKYWWNDVCFSINKTSGTKISSSLVFSIGRTTD